MGFFRQLRLLVWKNFLIRRRNKLRLCLEIIWPLFLFLILMWVRTRGLKEVREECHYLEKAMPSAGQFAFFHSLICSAPNRCHLNNGSLAPPYDDGTRPKLTDLTNEVGQLLLDGGKLPRLIRNYGDLGVILGTVERNGTLGDEFSLQVQDLLLPTQYDAVPAEWLTRQVDVKRLDKAMLVDSPGVYYCKKAGQSKVPPEEMCSENVTFIWNDVEKSANTYRDRELGAILRPSAWHRFQVAVGSMLLDLDTINLNNISPGAWAILDRMRGKRDATKSPVEGWCDLLEYEGDSRIPENEYTRALRGEQMQLKSRYHPDPDEPPECEMMFNSSAINKIPGVAAVWKVIKPFIRGKILYTPDTPAVRSVMERVNQTFNDLLSIHVLKGVDTETFLTRIEQGFFVREMPKTAAGNALMSASVRHNNRYLLPIVLTKGPQLRRLQDMVGARRDGAGGSGNATTDDEAEDSMGAAFSEFAQLLLRFTKCLDTNHIQPVATEDAEDEAVKLARTNNLWALVVFDAAGNETLEPFVKYRLRLSAERVDSTTDIMDRRTNYRSRDQPLSDLKYLTYGFAYLQDMIDSAILEAHTGHAGETNPGRILKQYPYPEYIYDQFIKAISNTFPMFMVLAWVFTSALTVKSIVYEKEQRIKETLGVMGLSNGVHWAGWFLDTFGVMFVSLTCLSLILVYGKVIEKSAFSVVWVFLLSFAMATMSLSFLISVFFSRANVAAAAAGIVYFTTYMPYSLVIRFADLIPYSGFVGVSLVSNMAFGLGASVFAAYEQTAEGAQWHNLDLPANTDELITLGLCIRMLWLDAVIYAVLTWYIEAVFPGQYGIPKPYLFFLHRSYWCGAAQPSDMNGYLTNGDGVAANNMEAEPSNGIIGVSIEKLSKVFGSKAAVNGLSLNFYQDQITAFLGHNGAGKTTTISMLTGMYPPSSGTARVYGLDIRTDMDSIRSSMGVCPQHNVLFDSLTVEEHLLFFGLIKGLDEAALRSEIGGMLRDMGLEHKRHAASRDLSGGMKRKLSVGMAFVGGSRTVFLDEPTAGVDPFSRRAIWELLIKYRKGRTVILTTHFMDEADLLGDRIAIISNGRLQCCGSSVFLKARFGSGYYLTVEWQRGAADSDKMELLRQLVTGTVGSAQVAQEMNSESVFVLPDRHDVPAITSLLERMDENRDSLGIESYGISDTSLEEIFLKVVEEKEPVANGNHAVSVDERVAGTTEATAVPEEDLLGGAALLKQQYLALSRKRFNYVRRDPKGLFTQLVLPAVFVALALTFTSFFNITAVMPELVLEPRLYGDPVVAFWQMGNESKDLASREVHYSSMRRDGVGSELAPARNHSRDPELPTLVRRRLDLARSTASADNTCSHSPPELTTEDGATLEQAAVELPGNETYYNGTGVDVEQWIVDTYPECKRNRYGGVTYGATYPWTKDSNLPVVGLNNKPDNLRVWYDNKGHAAAPSYLNAMNNVVLRSLLPEDKRNASREYGILTSSQPLPLTPEQYKDKTITESGIVLFHAVCVIFAMSFVPASFIIFLIEDRVAQSKHLQLVSGLRPYIYWLQSYTWDLMSFAASEVMVVLIFIAFQSAMYTSGTNLVALILLIFLYGTACIPLLYLFSWLFKIPSLAFVILSCGNLFIGMITTLTVLVLGMFEELELQNIRKVLEVVFLIFPQYCLGQGLMNMATNYMNAEILAKQDMVWSKSVLAWDVTGKFLLTLAVISAVLVTLVFVVEQSTHWCHRGQQADPRSGLPLENDVQQEFARVDSGHADKDVLVLKRLTKVYRQGAPPAVDGVSLGVSAGECFGLLGLNGAGKTSIFKMLTGDTSISGGDAHVAGRSVRSDMDGVRKLVGYCPQFDALIPLLTVREHLDLYCSLRGMPSSQRPRAVDRALRRLNLGFHQDKQAKSLSGGNKRKLSTAIALVGDPPLLYMDEPTTSMDPGARRFLWDCVQSVVASGRSVVLTSHSMEECQALCGKITIMVNGQLTCFGSPQHLKNKYGSGYSVVVRCRQHRVTEVRDSVLQRLAGSVVVEAHLNQVKFHVPPAPRRLVTIFRTLDQARQDGGVLDYSVSQTTLEDVFMRFAQLQKTEEKPATESVGCMCLDWLRACVSPLRTKEVEPRSPARHVDDKTA